MGETQNRSSTSRLGLLRGSGSGGEIIEVQGGHIVRSTGRKDRHSKVCTAKGPRDRRVRLSAHTAIQFYDVQDRLGYDRPSRAVDWLIKKAKSAIDELAELPPWHPTATMPTANTLNPSSKSPEHHQIEEDEEENQLRSRGNQNEQGFLGSSSKSGRQIGGVEQTAGRYIFLQNQQEQQKQHQQNNSFLPPSLDSDSIADTIKSFFPMATSSSSIHFQNYSSPPDLLSRTNSQTQDLRLSLQSFQDPMFHHHHSQQHQHHHSNPSSEQLDALFSTAFDTSGGGGSTNAWSEQQMQEMGTFQRMIAWNPNTDSGGGGNGNGSGSSSGGFMFNSLPQPPQPSSSQQAVQQTLFSNSPNPFFSQRGPLQSSNSPSSISAWNNITDPSMVSDDNQNYQNPNSSIHHHHQHQQQQPFASGGFGFRIPARIQGEEEHDVGASHKPPSSASRH